MYKNRVIATTLMWCIWAIGTTVLAKATQWQQDAQSGQVALQQGDPMEAGRSFISALSKLHTTQINETDPAYRQLVFEFISADVFDLCIKHAYADTENLAKWKLAVGEARFGPSSVSAIDALSDLSMVYKTWKRYDMDRTTTESMNQRIINALQRDEGKKEELMQVVNAKKRLYFSKLGPALETILGALKQ